MTGVDRRPTLKRSEKYALWSTVVALAIGIPLGLVTGGLGLILGAMIGAGMYRALLKQKALERAVNSEILDQ